MNLIVVGLIIDGVSVLVMLAGWASRWRGPVQLLGMGGIFFSSGFLTALKLVGYHH